MSIDRSILSEFIKATNDNKETKQTQLYGTVVTQGNSKCVKIDGSEIVTPVRSITDIKDDERVMVSIKDHMATVTGNMTNPSVGNDRVESAEGKIDRFDHLFAGNITTENIAAGSITADKILAGSITTDKLMAESIIADKIAANAIESKHIKADTIESSHIKADTIESSHIKANTIESDHIQSNTINSNHINSNTINSDHIVAGSITSENIATGTITAGSGIIAEGAIGSAQISSLDVAKLESGTIDTSKIYIAGADGHLQLKGNRLQVFDGFGDRAVERVSVGDVNGDGSKFGLRVRGVDGETILLDENGVTSEGITDGSITNNKISDDANIDGAKLNINSVVSKINEDGTETIQGTKIEVDGTTLNTKLSTITNKQTEDGERITQAQSQISANTNAIKLKVDEQTYTTDKKDMTSKLEKNTSEISTMKGQIALKVEQADIENAKSEIEGVIDTKVNSAKSEIKITTDAISQNVSNLTQTVSNKADGSTVSSLNSKVSSLETSVNGISGKVTSLEKTTTTLGTQVDAANTNASSALNKANSATTTANNAQNTANTNKSNITDLQGEVSTVKSNVASLEVTTSGISQKVSSVESTTATLSGKVNTANNNATNALNKANSANTLADSKATVFTSTPTVPYKVGDLWVQGTNGDVMKCKTARASGSYTASDWEKASKYTDDTKANAVDGKVTTLQGTVNTTNSKVATLETNLNGITQRVSSTESTTATLTTKVTNAQNTANQAKTDAGNANSNATNALNKANSANTLADSKAKVFTSTPTTPYKVGDLWVQGTNGDVMRCKTARTSGSYTASDWEKASKYTDDTKANAVDGKVTTLQGEYNTTKSKVATLETNLDGITQRVSSTETTTATLTTKVNTVEGAANAAKSTADSAKTTATNAQNSANSANSKIDNLEIGSANLILGTKYFTIDNSREKGWYNQGGFTITQDDDCKIATHSASGLTSNAIKGLYSTYIPCKKGDTFTVSVYIKVENVNNWDEKKPFIVEGYNATNTRIEYVDVSINHNGSNKPTLINNEWTRFVYTYTITNVDTISFGIRLSLFKNGKISFKKAQIEKGNKVSDWSIASDDLQFQIDTTTTEISKTKSQVSEIKTDLNGITSRVGKVETNQTSINGQVTGLESRMSNAESKITESAITNVVKESQFIKDINGNITTNKNNISKIEQTSNSITSSVKDLEGKYTEIKQTVDGIDLTGKVSFSDLSTSGRTTINGANITTGTIDTNKVNIKGNTTRKIVIANDNYCVYDGTETDINRKVFMGFRPYNSNAQYIPSVMLGYNGINPNVDGAVVSGGTYTTYSHYPNNNNPESINLSYGALAFKYGASGTQFSTINLYQNGDIDLKAGKSIYFRPNLRAKDNHVFAISDVDVGCRVPFKCTSTIFTNGDITTDRNVHAYGNISASGSMSCGTILPNNISIGSSLSINSNGVYTTGHITGNMVKTDSYRFTNNYIAFGKSDYNNNMMNGCNWDWQYYNLVNVKVYPVSLSLPTIDEPIIQTVSKTQKDTLSQIKFPEARELSVEESAPSIDISDVTNKEEITTNGDVDLIKLVYLLVKDVQTLKQENEIIKAELKELQSK